MCLHTVDSKTKDFTYGWKVFRKVGRKLFGQYYMHSKYIYYNSIRTYPKKDYKVNEWIQDNQKGRIHRRYEKGFHFYKTRKDARKNKMYDTNEVVRKIKVRNIVASGKQDFCVVGVAKEMMILTDKV